LKIFHVTTPKKAKWEIILDHLDEIRAFVGVLPEQSDPGF